MTLAALLRAPALLVPALLPSWRFFDSVGPSPRIEIATAAAPEDWRPLRPRPVRVDVAETALRLVWNPGWNETLFLVSCAERVLEDGRPHAQAEIVARARAAHGIDGRLRFRILTVARQGTEIGGAVAFVSDWAAS